MRINLAVCYRIILLIGFILAVRAQRLCCDARRLVRPATLARRLCADGLQELRREDAGGARARVRLAAFTRRQESADRVSQDAVI